MFDDCTAECAVPVPCPTCGRSLPPLYRALPDWMASSLDRCCEAARNDSEVNTRHVWSVDELGIKATVESMAAGLLAREDGED